MSEQELHCQSCGRKFLTRFNNYDGRVCCMKCWKEVEWRRTLSILGRKYYPDPTASSERREAE